MRFSLQRKAVILTLPLTEMLEKVRSAIVRDYMETTVFPIVCDLRFAIRDRLRSSAIIWKPAFNHLHFCYRVSTCWKGKYDNSLLIINTCRGF